MDFEGYNPVPVSTPSTPSEIYKRQKVMSINEERISPSTLYSLYLHDDYKRNKVLNHDDPFAVRNLVEELTTGNYGSVTKDIEELVARREEMMRSCLRRYPALSSPGLKPKKEPSFSDQPVNPVHDANGSVKPVRDIVMFNDKAEVHSNASELVVIIDSDDEEPECQRPFQPFQDTILNKPAGQFLMKQFLDGDYAHGRTLVDGETSIVRQPKSKKESKKEKSIHDNISKKEKSVQDAVEVNKEKKSVEADVQEETIEGEIRKDKGVYVGVEDDEMDETNQQSDVNFDGLADIWQEMAFGLECSKDSAVEVSFDEHVMEDEEECDHSFLLKDDIGYVCRVCGVIGRGIETIIEYQNAKGSRNTRTYKYEGRSSKEGESTGVLPDDISLPDKDFSVAEICAHPRHKRHMKPHQVEGFNFLLSNLVTENPGGCILAHAPGSGKTFMLISFIQSFMAKYPNARPLVVLPRGILMTWKKEFKRWQVEDIPLLDFYSVKADSRSQQLEVLKQWAKERSILFLGYKQFSSIVCDNDTSAVTMSCQEILLTYPSIMILDEGHTPRNQDTDQLTSLEKVQTPRKVVLSGTLYQNHVKEVFNILNLVRPKFLRLENSKAIKKRILSRVPITSRKNILKKGSDNEFYELVEHTLLKDENFKRKVTVIEDLREMTSKVLHYYKGDFLDELPGLVDFSVFLNLSPRQKREVSELKKLVRKFKISSDGSAIYVHPQLKALAKGTTAKDRVDEGKIDELLAKLDYRDGVKTKFFINLLRLCESSGEKLLVFGQYLLPLKFLERLTMKLKGWSSGREIFMITGDSDSDFREHAMDRFNNSPDAKVFFGSIKACGEGISLVGASRIIILDVHLNPSVTRQALGRAFRPGQERKVYTYRLVAAGSPEEEDHSTCFKKESIAKMWFEWNEYCGHHDFEMETANVNDCGDEFLETSGLNEDVVALYKR